MSFESRLQGEAGWEATPSVVPEKANNSALMGRWLQ